MVASVALPEPVPVPPLQPIDPAALPSSARLVPAPAGCTTPPKEQAVFIGRVVAVDTATARFDVEQVRSGSIEGFTADGLIDVRYGDEVRFLDLGTTYIVGTAANAELRALTSSVRGPAPLFGGNEIAGVGRSDVQCPALEDPIRTLLLDGTSVESGVVTPLKEAKGDVARAVLEPIGVAFVVLVALVAVKHLVWALGRSLRDLGNQRS
jgi:hypothetical protein